MTRRFRLKVDELTPHIMEAMGAFDEASDKISLPESLRELVRVRSSQLNGCAFCLEAHAAGAKEAGVTERQLVMLSTWREAPDFDAREQAALALTEALTLVSQGPVSDEVWAAAGEQFSEVELAELTWTIAVINVWNRVAGGARPWPVGRGPWAAATAADGE